MIGQRQQTQREQPWSWVRLALLVAVLCEVVAAGWLLSTGRLGISRRPATLAVDQPTTSAASTQVPHTLHIVTHPPGATVTITAANQPPLSDQTPFNRMLPGGVLNVSLTFDGHNPLRQKVVLDRDRTLDLWLDPAGLLHHKLGEFSTGSNPKQVAFSPDSRQLWVTLLGGKGVEVFDPFTQTRLTQINLGQHGAVEVIFSSDGSTAYVSQMESATVFEIDRKTFSVRRQIATGGVWSKVMALSSNGKTLYVANWSSNDVSEIDLITGTVRRRIPTVRTPRGLYPTPDGKRLFVAGFGKGELARINLTEGTSETLLTTGGALRHLVGDPKRGLLYANDMSKDETYVVDLTTEQIRKLAKTNEKPNTIDLTPGGEVLYISNRGANNPRSYYLPGPEWGSVLVIDTGSGAVLDAIVGGNQTTGLDVSPNGRYLAFSDFLDNRVQIFRLPPYKTLVTGGGGRAKAHVADLAKRSGTATGQRSAPRPPRASKQHDALKGHDRISA